ncbi:MAG: hypothetical protein WEC59_05785 [Salibacteraceae bacterium]
MNKLFTLLFSAAFILFLSSCEKCSTCTSVSDDPQTMGEQITDEVCGTGKNYSDQIEIYERTGWDCSGTEE